MQIIYVVGKIEDKSYIGKSGVMPTGRNKLTIIRNVVNKTALPQDYYVKSFTDKETIKRISGGDLLDLVWDIEEDIITGVDFTKEDALRRITFKGWEVGEEGVNKKRIVKADGLDGITLHGYAYIPGTSLVDTDFNEIIIVRFTLRGVNTYYELTFVDGMYEELFTTEKDGDWRIPNRQKFEKKNCKIQTGIHIKTIAQGF